MLWVCERIHDPVWCESLSYRYPGYTLRELVAIRLILEAAESVELSPDQMAKRKAALCAQIQESFGRPAPVELADAQKPM